MGSSIIRDNIPFGINVGVLPSKKIILENEIWVKLIRKLILSKKHPPKSKRISQFSNEFVELSLCHRINFISRSDWVWFKLATSLITLGNCCCHCRANSFSRGKLFLKFAHLKLPMSINIKKSCFHATNTFEEAKRKNLCLKKSQEKLDVVKIFHVVLKNCLNLLNF